MCKLTIRLRRTAQGHVNDDLEKGLLDANKRGIVQQVGDHGLHGELRSPQVLRIDLRVDSHADNDVLSVFGISFWARRDDPNQRPTRIGGEGSPESLQDRTGDDLTLEDGPPFRRRLTHQTIVPNHEVEPVRTLVHVGTSTHRMEVHASRGARRPPRHKGWEEPSAIEASMFWPTASGAAVPCRRTTPTS